MDWMLEKCTRYLYVRELANDKFYVGQSKDPDKRIRKHFSGSGSAWTRLHPPVKELARSRLEYVDYRMGESAENKLVLQLMHPTQPRSTEFADREPESHRAGQRNPIYGVAADSGQTKRGGKALVESRSSLSRSARSRM